MNLKKSLTYAYSTTSSNTEPGGQDTQQNTTRDGTWPMTLKIKTSQSAKSTAATQTSCTLIKLAEQVIRDILVSVQQAWSKQAALYWPVKAQTPQENCGTMRCLQEMTRTSISYHSPCTEEEAEHKHKKYMVLHWTEYYNNNCWVHNSDKVARGWYPKQSNTTRSSWKQPYETIAPAL